ncbi:MAG: DUF4394 domain-containing protein [Betaproteobacteria bacterium]|nr:MAG: DUF4394 domain-containing protein [Betaproteobacteria bacterium]
MPTTLAHRQFRSAFCALILLCLSALSSFAAATPTLYAILSGNIVSFKPDAPGTLLTNRPDVGTSDSARAIEIDPTTGHLYAMYQTSATSYGLRRINLSTGYVSDLSLFGTLTTTSAAAGVGVGLAYDPLAHGLRVITAAGDNFLISLATAQPSFYFSPPAYITGDTGFGITPYIEHIAYTNAIPSPSTTTLYGIDTQRNVLVRVGTAGSPYSTQAYTVSTFALGINPTDYGGFVIDPATNRAYAAMTVDGAPRLYEVNLVTGVAIFLGQIGTSATARVEGLAAAPGVNHCLDIDGDGEILAHRDGLMLTRIALGMTGSAVLANAIPTFNPPPRTTWAAIRTHLVDRCGMTITP